MVHDGLRPRGLKTCKKGNLFAIETAEDSVHKRFAKNEIINYMNQRDAVRYYYHGSGAGLRPSSSLKQRKPSQAQLRGASRIGNRV